MPEAEKIQIQVNGKPVRLQHSLANVEHLLKELEITNPAVAVEINRSIVTRNEFELVNLKSGDVVEIVSLVGGG